MISKVNQIGEVTLIFSEQFKDLSQLGLNLTQVSSLAFLNVTFESQLESDKPVLKNWNFTEFSNQKAVL